LNSRIKLLPAQIPAYWELIKHITVKVDEVNEKDIQPYLNELLHALLNGKAQCFLELSDSRNVVAVCITRLRINKITGEKYLFIQNAYAFKVADNEARKQSMDFLKEFAKKEQCSYLFFKSCNKRIWELGKSSGFREKYWTRSKRKMTKIYTKIVLDMKSGQMLEEQSFNYHGDVALCGGGGGGGDTKTEIRYAGYVEDKHKDFLNVLAAQRASDIDNSPFADYTELEVDVAFFGTGYLISSFPSLYDMYGKFMAGLDVDVLYSQIFEDTVNAPEINSLVAAESAMMDDDINMNVLPRFQTGMRDINSVMASSFVCGRAAIEDARVKALSRFSAELKYRMIPVVTDRWRTHLDWNRHTVVLYAEIMRTYYQTKTNIEEHFYHIKELDAKWPWTVLGQERAGLGALQGAKSTDSEYRKKMGWQETVGTIAAVIGMAAMFL